MMMQIVPFPEVTCFPSPHSIMGRLTPKSTLKLAASLSDRHQEETSQGKVEADKQEIDLSVNDIC